MERKEGVEKLKLLIGKDIRQLDTSNWEEVILTNEGCRKGNNFEIESRRCKSCFKH